MKKILLLCTLVLTLSFTFCKKKSNTPETTNTDTPITSNGAYSNLQTIQLITEYNHVVTKDSMVAASFYDQPPTASVPNFINAGLVTLNSSSLTLNTGNSYSIYSPIPVNISGNLNWTVAGSGTLTAFNYSYPANYPKYTGAASLPDTCIKANGITININGISNHPYTSGVTVLLSQSTSIYKSILTDAGTISFSASELSAINSNSSISILVSVGNYTTVVAGGVKHGFSNNLQYTKGAYLK